MPVIQNIPSFGYWLNVILLLVSGLTMFIAGLRAYFKLKRIIALSTLRQLSLITISIGLSGFFFHLFTHALFKALLFICAGGVIHSIGDSQDICFIVGLSAYILFTSSSLMVSNCAHCVYHFWLDLILEMFSMRYINMFGFSIICVYGFDGLLFFPFVLFCTKYIRGTV
jgi:NADH:ubiquinone oxidoreductase subunit 5 (subunit L)/multisubunit Na+/H+ antiporter MnhA subunit